MPDAYSVSLQENLLTLLATDDVNGKVVAQLIDVALFEGDYRVVAERCVKYWRQMHEAPKAHLADLFDDELQESSRRSSTFKRIIRAINELSTSLNSAYILSQIQRFTRLQRLKAGILKSAEQLNQRQDIAIEEVEGIWNELLRTREINFDVGMRLFEYDRVLTHFENSTKEFTTGIPQLDDNHIVPYRGSALLFIAATGRGKTWFCINLAKQALLLRKKVVHISLEMSEEQVTQRYYQSLFSVTKRNAEVSIAVLKKDRFGKIKSIEREKVKPEFSFESPHVREELEYRVNYWGAKLSNVLIKRFTPRSLSVAGLAAYLDNLETVERFIPDLLIVDYLGIMKTDTRDYRLSLGRTFEELRGLAVDRHIALVTPHQASKAGATARVVNETHAAEDWSLNGTADQVITLSMTDAEKAFGLGRLFVSKARSEKDKFGILFTHNYDCGQFALDSTMLNDSYWDHFKEMFDDEDPDAEYDNDDAKGG